MGARLICIVGLDGSGKTTLTRGLFEELKAAGHKAAELHFWPTLPLSAYGSGGRSSLKPLSRWRAYALWALMRLMTCFRLRPLLRGNDYVLCDRYPYDLAAYLSLRGRGEVARRLIGSGLKPDLVLWLDADPHLLAQRKPLEHPISIYRAWAEIYRSLIGDLRGFGVKVAAIDASKAPEGVLRQAREALKQAGLLSNRDDRHEP